MGVFSFSQSWIEALVIKGNQSPRLRCHSNIHTSHSDPCQSLFNAIGVDSYIRPHRHLLDPKPEYLLAVRGVFALITFFDNGVIQNKEYFGTELYQSDKRVSVGVLLQPDVWHTVIALVPNSVLMEVKPGPFLPDLSKDLASWSPIEGSTESFKYLMHLKLDLDIPSP